MGENYINTGTYWFEQSETDISFKTKKKTFFHEVADSWLKL